MQLSEGQFWFTEVRTKTTELLKQMELLPESSDLEEQLQLQKKVYTLV